MPGFGRWRPDFETPANGGDGQCYAFTDANAVTGILTGTTKVNEVSGCKVGFKSANAATCTAIVTNTDL